jgi:hypothetical protein
MMVINKFIKNKMRDVADLMSMNSFQYTVNFEFSWIPHRVNF